MIVYEVEDTGRGMARDRFEDEDAEDPVETEVYTDGHGTITFTDGDPLTLVWRDQIRAAGYDLQRRRSAASFLMHLFG